jgi:hypothetical protein
MVWLLILVAYQAPPDAVDWNGPWTLGIRQVLDTQFDSEAECRTYAIRAMAQLHQAMRAPLRFRCVPVEASLPVGAAR